MGIITIEHKILINLIMTKDIYLEKCSISLSPILCWQYIAVSMVTEIKQKQNHVVVKIQLSPLQQ